MRKFPRNHRPWAMRKSEGDLVHSTAPKQSHPTCAIPQKCSSACSPNLQIPELWSPDQGMLLKLRHCHHWLEKTSHTFVYASITYTKQMKEAATIVSVTCLGYNRPCICNMDVFCSSFSILFPALRSFSKKKNNLFFRVPSLLERKHVPY